MGMIFDIKRYAVHDGPGIRTTVFFKGCPLRCRWCHNPESILREPEPPLVAHSGGCEMIGSKISAADLLDDIERDRIFHDESGGGVTFSGGEPLDQPAFLKEILRLCHEHEVHTVVDTCVHAPWEALAVCAPLVDLFLCDLKHMDSDQHQTYTGVPNGLILENVRRLAGQGSEMVMRIPVIPGVNDTADNISATGSFISRLPGVRRVDLLPYNEASPAKQARLAERAAALRVAATGRAHLERIAARLEEWDLDVNLDG